jgi:hypothetical protein
MVYQSYADKVAKSRLQWEADNIQLLSSYDQAKVDVDNIEGLIRERVAFHYERTGDKHPAPGVNIRVLTRLEYDPVQAFEWAKSHGLALSLDKKAFESIAKVQPLDFVTKVDAPQATISTNLDKVLEQEDA